MTTPAAKPKQEWSPRLWHGADLYAWLRLLVRNRFAVQPPYWHIAAVASVASLMNSTLRLLTDAAYGGQVERTVIREAPLFIVGHWRTGTTLLHELLILDPRHTFPTTFQCLVPHHWLLTETRLSTHLLVPDAVAPADGQHGDGLGSAAGGRVRPGRPRPAVAVPDHRLPQPPAAGPGSFRPGTAAAPRAGRPGSAAFLHFLRGLTFKDPRRLVLKSPTHSCRIKTLLELFPDARFVHIVRDPHVVFPSTVNLWKSLYRNHGLQTPTFAGLEEQVFETFNHLYAKLEEGKRLVAPGRFHELRYEDLIRDPEGEMRLLYDRLGLGGFDDALPRRPAVSARTRRVPDEPLPVVDAGAAGGNRAPLGTCHRALRLRRLRMAPPHRNHFHTDWASSTAPIPSRPKWT